MNENESPRMTALDQMVSDDSLQAMKAVIPYAPSREQQFLSVFIKFMELKKTFQMFQKPENDMKMASAEPSVQSPADMLQDIRQHTGGSVRESIDNLLNAFQTIQVFQMYQEMEEGKNEYGSKLDESSQSGLN
ncbi:MAG: hypothetical protein ACOX8E_02160 [Ruminococcus sp.]|jgi:hypothetical protein